eukprot:4596527-Pleurochrysis_carterae.AAC.3
MPQVNRCGVARAGRARRERNVARLAWRRRSATRNSAERSGARRRGGGEAAAAGQVTGDYAALWRDLAASLCQLKSSSGSHEAGIQRKRCQDFLDITNLVEVRLT